MGGELIQAHEMLGDPSAGVRCTGARAMARFDPGRRPPGGSEAHALTTDALAELLRSDRDDGVRVEAGVALAGFTDARAFQAVAEALRENRVSHRLAVRVLSLGSPPALRRIAVDVVVSRAREAGLLAGLASHEDPDVAVAAAAALGEEGHEEAVPALIDALAADEADLVDAAAGALARIGDPRALAPLVRACLDADMSAARGSRYGTTRWSPEILTAADRDIRLVDEVATFGSAAAELLVRSVRDRADVPIDAQAKVVAALRAVGPPGRDAILDAAGATDPVLRRVAVAALAAHEGTEVVDALVAATRSGDEPTRAAAFSGLGSARGAVDVNVLLEGLADPSLPVRRLAEHSLVALAATDPAVARALGNLLHARPLVAAHALTSLAGAPGMPAVLAGAVRDGALEARMQALVAVRDAPSASVHDELLDHRPLEQAITAATRDADPHVGRLAREAHDTLSVARQERARLRHEVHRPNGGPLLRERALDRDASAERFPDVQLYPDDPSAGPLAADQALLQGTWYRLEVAVRVTRIGYMGVDIRPLRTPETGEPAQALLVGVDSDDFDVENPVGRIRLPREGDSTENAWFRLRPLRTASGPDRATAQIRIYYAYNLLEVLAIDAEVRPRLGGETAVASPAVELRRVRREREYEDLSRVRPRSMSIDVDQVAGGYRLAFAFKSDTEDVVLRAPLRLTPEELDSQLVGVRELWREIALESPFEDALEVTEEEGIKHMARLADAGSRLWTTLFRHDAHGALTRIGELLRRDPPPAGAVLQISIDPSAPTFVFPWGLLYDRPRRRGTREPPDPEGFWGLRYAIEQGVPGLFRGLDPAPPGDGAGERELTLAFMLWRRFRNARDQIELLDRLGQRAKGRLTVKAPPILDADSCFDILEQGSSDILYFYTHGFTRRREVSNSLSEELDRFTRRYEALADDDPRRASLRLLYDAMASGADTDRSYIELSYGRVYLDELYQYIDELLSTPLVLLNMCESAQVTPSLSDSFVHFFLDRGAPCVIGTECPMTVTFAHPFAEELLTRILSGEAVGAALLRSRRRFVAGAHNPLGLAYTLYGSAETSFLPPCLPATPTSRSPG